LEELPITGGEEGRFKGVSRRPTEERGNRRVPVATEEQKERNGG